MCTEKNNTLKNKKTKIQGKAFYNLTLFIINIEYSWQYIDNVNHNQLESSSTSILQNKVNFPIRHFYYNKKLVNSMTP